MLNTILCGGSCYISYIYRHDIYISLRTYLHTHNINIVSIDIFIKLCEREGRHEIHSADSSMTVTFLNQPMSS